MIRISGMEYFTTNELAEQAGVSPGAIRVSLHRHGSYGGLRPYRTVTGRVLWSASDIAAVVPKREGT